MEQTVILFFVLLSIIKAKGENINCEERNKCEVSRGRLIPFCYCDNDCFLYNDCCKEYYEAHVKAKHSKTSLPISMKCKLLTNENYLLSERIGAFMVDRCKQTDSLCQVTSVDLDTFVPVSIGNTTYRNAKCALCNNVTKFSFWNIAISINPKTEKNLKTGKITSDDTLFANIKNVSFSEDMYYLHPPKGVTVRFCSYDVQIKGETTEEKFNYQNTNNCNNTWYKNGEMCERDGCCGFIQGKHCIGYNLKLFRNVDDFRSQRNHGFHLIIEFKPSKIDEETHFQEKMSVDKVTFSDLQVYIIIELKDSEKGIVSAEDCVYGIISYLLTTTYGLIPESYHIFGRKMEGDTQVFFLVLRSTKKLTLSKLTDLLQLQSNVQCEGKDGSVTANGKFKISTIDENEELFRSRVIHDRIMDLHRFRIMLSRINEPCRNLSIIILRSEAWEIPVEVHCLNEIFATSGAKNRCLYTNILMCAASFMILVGRFL